MDYRTMTLAEVAKFAPIYEGAHGELHRRQPNLIGFWGCVQWLATQEAKAYWDARGGFDPWAKEPPASEAWTLLHDEYWRQVTNLAEGGEPWIPAE